MTVEIGSQLGQYVVTSHLGTGGMGEVYRARDSKLKREVAIKVLPAAFLLDGERVSRFQREAEALASLNHPHVAAIYDFAEIGDIRFLVLELVEGETLAARVARGPILVEEALRIAGQIAEGLEAAHEKGIVHRDLKPGNVTIASDGQVKVLDFGLAKVREANLDSAALSNSPTMLSASRDGVVLGTVAYMSPEQARGKLVDKRSDIWAFGAVLFEMLTGKQAFPGETVSDTIVSVLSREVEWSALPTALPARIRDLLRRCLQRESAQRLRDIGDARIEIAEALTSGPVVPSAEPPSSSGRMKSMVMLGFVAAGIVIGAALVSGWLALRPARQETASWTGTLLGGPNVAWTPRLSPDGKTLAFIGFVDGLTQVGVMNPESGNWTMLTRDRARGYVSRISWARDGSRIFYNRHTDVPIGVFSVPALGGDERLVLENANGAEPLADGSLLVARINAERKIQIHRYWPGDGRLNPLPGLLQGSEGMPLRVLPDGRRAVFLGKSLDQAASDARISLYTLDLTTEKAARIPVDIPDLMALPQSEALAILPDGHTLVVSRPNGDLTKLIGIDLDRPDRVRSLIDLPNTPTHADVGPDGSLYVDQTERPGEVVRFATSGRELERLNAFPNVKSFYGQSPHAVHSPDGKTWMSAIVGGRSRLFVALPGQGRTPFIESDEETSAPLALVGEDRVAFIIGRGDRRQIALASRQDGRIVGRIADVKAASVRSMVASRDGRTLYYVDSGLVWSVPIAGGQPRKIHNGDGVVLTPDGEHLIIQLIETERVRWLQVGLDGGGEQPIPVKDDVRFTFAPVGPSAVGPDGRIALPISVKDAWFWAPAIFDPSKGTVERIPLPFKADPPYPAWTPDGRIIVTAYSVTSSLWRFRPAQDVSR